MKDLIRPIDLQAKSTPLDVSGKYDWKKQVYQYDSCKFGSTSRTQNQTCSGQYNFVDDFPTDSYTD